MSGDTTGNDSGTVKDSGTDSKTDDKATKDSGTTDTKAGDADVKDGDVSGLRNTVKALRKERDDLVKAQRDAELAKLPELERAQTEALQLKDQNEKLTVENMRLKTGLKLRMPWSLAKRITGDTEEEMESDAAELMKDYKMDDSKNLPSKDDPKNKRPPNDAKRTGPAGKPGMNEILRALRKG